MVFTSWILMNGNLSLGWSTLRSGLSSCCWADQAFLNVFFVGIHWICLAPKETKSRTPQNQDGKPDLLRLIQSKSIKAKEKSLPEYLQAKRSQPAISGADLQQISPKAASPRSKKDHPLQKSATKSCTQDEIESNFDLVFVWLASIDGACEIKTGREHNRQGNREACASAVRPVKARGGKNQVQCNLAWHRGKAGGGFVPARQEQISSHQKHYE